MGNKWDVWNRGRQNIDRVREFAVLTAADILEKIFQATPSYDPLNTWHKSQGNLSAEAWICRLLGIPLFPVTVSGNNGNNSNQKKPVTALSAHVVSNGYVAPKLARTGSDVKVKAVKAELEKERVRREAMELKMLKMEKSMPDDMTLFLGRILIRVESEFGDSEQPKNKFDSFIHVLQLESHYDRLDPSQKVKNS